MKPAVSLGLAGLWRRPGRTALRITVIAIAVGLLAGMILFIGNSLRTASATALRDVPLDLQGPVTSYKKDLQVAGSVGKQPDVAYAAAAATAPFASAERNAGGLATQTASGAVLAVPHDYLAHVHTFRMLQGSLRPGGVVLDQQMAATLQARIGDTIRLRARPNSPPQSYPVSGVALITSPDVLFQPLNPLLGPAPAQPPQNGAIMLTPTFAKTLARQLPQIATGATGASAQPGAQTGTQWQVQAQLDRTPLTSGSPSSALNKATHTVNRIQSNLPGQVQFVNNISDSLNGAAGDALYAETLFLLLAVPGALIALGVAYLAALGTSESDRRDLALLRARGARPRDLLLVAGVESVLIGLIAGLAGLALGLAAVQLLVSGGVQLTFWRGLAVALAAIGLSIVGSAAARLASTRGALAGEVSEGRTAVGSKRVPAWRRYYLDFAALALSGLIYWLTIRTGFSAVVSPDSNPTLSLSVYMFFGPALLWIGATLLLVRLRGRFMRALAQRASGKQGGLGSLVMASLGRRATAVNRGLVVIGLLLAFAVSLGIFTATYNQQAQVDAQLTLGADVTVNSPPGVAGSSPRLASTVASVRGVAATTPVNHSYAYVGPDLQDTFGIDPAHFRDATSLRDSYFIGGSADQMMNRLASTPNGILVSKETITDYSLSPGSLLRLRVLDQQTGRFRVAPFHVVGTVQEFPSAPRDSFMVTNLDYLNQLTHSSPNVVFAKTSGSLPAVASRVAAATRSLGTEVKNIDQQAAQTVTSITTVDLTGISHLEEVFAIVLVAAATAIFVLGAVAERRHEFATMTAIGASLRQVGIFVWSEVAMVLVAGALLAALLGWLLAQMLVAMLTHVFDPPPDHLALPWGFLGLLYGVAVLAGIGGSLLAARAVSRLPLGRVLRER
ncbi:MAG: FtsX-like permease family protein [Candidatus Limnocylindria bacterium]